MVRWEMGILGRMAGAIIHSPLARSPRSPEAPMEPGISIVGAAFQAVGVATLTILLVLASRALGAAYIRSWTRAWVWLAAA